ncbi:branched-chain amino acid ABC transporter permease [Chelatococcus reniformis]|uniref:Branched-chain amino acid ABC transporter permease n=1 Tax=Chelatococcus reniformis TaxID=1494448 RepID=A0A916ULX9_9HYPH|nr:branched-chain amino acid ABC transporter permease [Chelatococcus reniformis]GGC78172.1 branched-chain amino acid ABC transporter permease [Chelatococcus reniformis]
MRYQFKTSYDRDIDLFGDAAQRNWYLALLAVLCAAPLVLEQFWLGELSYVFILSIAAVGLMLLTGYTGQVSLCHGAFLGIGAYAYAVLLQRGVPFFVAAPLASLITAGVGAAIGFPALRLVGIYLAMATLAFNFIVEYVFVHWDSVTGGFSGFAVPQPTVFGYSIVDYPLFYYLTLAALLFALFVANNIMRAPTGRALIALRDSEVAAQSMGVKLTRYKTISFALSAGLTGFAGAFFAHKIGYLAPDAFGILLSIQLLLMVVVGGLGSFRGAIFGALFVGALPSVIALLRDFLPQSVARQPGLEPGLFGLILIGFILFEPHGIEGRWRKLRLFFSQFPMYRVATFKKQKSFTKSERFR